MVGGFGVDSGPGTGISLDRLEGSKCLVSQLPHLWALEAPIPAPGSL